MTDLYVKGKVHIAPLAFPPVVNVAQGVVPTLVVSSVVVTIRVVVSQTVPILCIWKRMCITMKTMILGNVNHGQ